MPSRLFKSPDAFFLFSGNPNYLTSISHCGQSHVILMTTHSDRVRDICVFQKKKTERLSTLWLFSPCPQCDSERELCQILRMRALSFGVLGPANEHFFEVVGKAECVTLRVFQQFVCVPDL